MTPENSAPQLINAEALAALLAVSKRTLWRKRSAGELPAPIVIGTTIRWNAEEIEQWIYCGSPPLKEWKNRRKVDGRT